MAIGTRDDGFTCFDWLAQGIEGLTVKFGQFIKKKHAVMGERHLAGLGFYAAPDKSCHRC